MPYVQVSRSGLSLPRSETRYPVGSRNDGTNQLAIPSGASNLKWRFTATVNYTYHSGYGGIRGYPTTTSLWYSSTGNIDTGWRTDLTECNCQAAAGTYEPQLLFRTTGQCNLENLVLQVYYDLDYDITVIQSTGGTASANKSSAVPGETVTLTATPATAFKLSGWSTSPSVTVSNNRFVMPSSNITVTPIWTKINYAITKVVNPAGAGVVTSNVNSANYGDTITLSQTPAAGYYFNGWTSNPSLNISSDQFTMPASAVTVTANYLLRSTGTLNKTTLKGGESAELTIIPDKAEYTHKYNLSFGTGMETGDIDVAAGTTGVTIQIPTSWATALTDAEIKTGGTLTLKTYSGTTLIGSYVISGLTYQVPDDAVPSYDKSAAVLRTIGGVPYANVGEVYTQGHSGVTAAISNAAGAYGSSIEYSEISLSGYSGAAYRATGTGNLTLESGLLTTAGQMTITYLVRDSRGRTVTKTETVNVLAYTQPRIMNPDIWRVDSAGDESTDGGYAKYHFTTAISACGTNAIQGRKIKVNGYAESDATENASTTHAAGEWFRSEQDKAALSNLQSFNATIRVWDKFEETQVELTLLSIEVLMHFSADGQSVSFGETAPEGEHVVKIGGNMTLMIGNKTLTEYINDIINS